MSARLLTKAQIEALRNDDLTKWYRSLRNTKSDMEKKRGAYADWFALTEEELAELKTFTWNYHEARRQLVARGLRKFDNP